ncbi:hypothetical protein GCM10027615_41410 [Plantactinospora veratri]
MCLWVAIALLVMPRTDRWWRWLTVLAAVVMPLAVATSRMYRGMHHPSDFAGATLLTALWIGLLWLVVRPNAELSEDSRRQGGDGAGTGPAGSSRPTGGTRTAETAPGSPADLSSLDDELARAARPD